MKQTLFSAATCFVWPQSGLLKCRVASLRPSFFLIKNFSVSCSVQKKLNEERRCLMTPSGVLHSIDYNPDSLLKNIPELNPKKEETVKDPNRKASVEQLLFVKNKIANHVRI